MRGPKFPVYLEEHDRAALQKIADKRSEKANITHKSESLVRFVANFCGDTQDLGVKGKSGILKSL